MDVRVVVQNISTSFAVFEAARYGKPLIERVVTVTGEGITEPENLLVKIGTLISHLIEECGGMKDGATESTFRRTYDGIRHPLTGHTGNKRDIRHRRHDRR